MRVRPADAEDGMSLSVPEDCEVVVPVVGVRLGVFFLAGVLFGAGASTGENCTGRCLGRDDRRRVSRMTSSSLGVVLCVCVCEREREIEREKQRNRETEREREREKHREREIKRAWRCGEGD